MASKWCCLFLALPCLAIFGGMAFMKSSAAARLSIAVNLFGWKGLMEVAREGFAQRLVGQKMTKSRVEPQLRPLLIAVWAAWVRYK